MKNGNKMFVVITTIVCAMVTCAISACSNGNKADGEHNDIDTINTIPVDTALRNRLECFAQKPRPQGNFAFHVFDITADKPVYGCNDTLALPSASCMKLLSGIAGLHLLGSNYEYHTEMLTSGKVTPDGTLTGNIAFKAGLDPQLMAADLNDFSKAVKDCGVKKVEGKIYVDLTITEPVKSERHWYPWDLTFSKYGLLYKGGDKVVKNLKASLRAHGVAVADSQVVVAHAPKGMKAVHTVKRPIDDVVKRMWKNSSNTQATAMLYTIGHRENPEADPVASGVAYLRRFLHNDLGMTDRTLCIHDGCGLCIYNRLSPKALTTILRFGYKNKEIRASLERNLPVSGVDGTLAREMTGPKTRGKVSAKTGTLSHPYGISSLAGFCEASNGHLLAFAIMDSEMSVLDARVLQRKLCEELVK